jgi:hypothetical protein
MRNVMLMLLVAGLMSIGVGCATGGADMEDDSTAQTKKQTMEEESADQDTGEMDSTPDNGEDEADEDPMN